MPSFQEFYDGFHRSSPVILLHILIGLNAFRLYFFREDCVPNDLLRTNLNVCVLLALDWHERRAHDKRILLHVCHAIIVALVCLSFLGGVVDYSTGLANVIKGLPDQHSCRPMTGTFDNVKWSFYATGQDCNTTAQEDAIQGAIAKYIRNAENGEICGTECLHLNHSCTWDGWLKLGSVSSFNENAYCGVGLPFDKCISGGNNDVSAFTQRILALGTLQCQAGSMVSPVVLLLATVKEEWKRTEKRGQNGR